MCISMNDRWKLQALAVCVVAACAALPGQSPSKQPPDLGDGFVSGTAQANGTTLHYVRGGTGSAVILPHGFPKTGTRITASCRCWRSSLRWWQLICGA